MDMQGQNVQPRTSRVFKWLICGVAVVAGFLLLADHQAHVFSVLPYLLLAACPLMHVFMHRGHGHHRHHHHDDSRRGGGSGSY